MKKLALIIAITCGTILGCYQVNAQLRNPTSPTKVRPVENERSVESSESLVQRGFEKAQNEEFEGAIADCTQAIRLDGKNIGAYVLRGSSYAQLDKLTLALTDLNRAIELDSRNEQAYLVRSGIYFKQLNFRKAYDDLTRVIQINPRNSLAYFGRAELSNNLGDIKGVIADITEVIRLEPSFDPAYNNRCYYLAKDLKEYQRALIDCEKAISLNPNPAYYGSRCLARAGIGDPRALEDCNIALKADPKVAGLFEDRGIARALLGDKEGALQDIRQAEKMYQEINLKASDRIQKLIKELNL